MKLKHLLTFALTLVLLACNDSKPNDEPTPPPGLGPNPYLKVFSTYMFVRGQGDSHGFQMYCNRPWRVVIADSDTSWVRVEPSSGRGGEGLIALKAYFGNHLDTPDDRLGRIKIEQTTEAGLSHTVELKQQSDYNIYRDSLALVEFFYAMGGPSWKVPWDLSKPLGLWGREVEVPLGMSWDGVWLGRFNGHRRVICIWYWNPNGLVGELPDCLGQLTYLQGIGFVGDKGITGELPLKALMSCNIDRITVSNCGLTGTLSKDINAFQNLDVLELQGNNITAIQDGFGELPHLEALMLGGNQIEGPLNLKWFNKMVDITILDLSNNNLTGELTADITLNKDNLQHLRLDGNRFSGYFPVSLRQSPLFASEYFCPQQEGFGFAPMTCD